MFLVLKLLVISKYIFTKLSLLVAVCYGYANETEQSPKAWLGSRLLQGAGRRFTPPAYPVAEFLPPYTGVWFLLNKGFFRWFRHRGTEKDEEILVDFLF